MEKEEDLSGSALPLAKEASIQRPDKSSMIKIADLLNLVKWDAAQYVPKRVDVRKLAEDEGFDCRFALCGANRKEHSASSRRVARLRRSLALDGVESRKTSEKKEETPKGVSSWQRMRDSMAD